MPTIKPFDRQGYYTVFDNFAIDHIMPAVSGNAWKVFSFVLRKTRGYHKESDMIALIQIRKGTGIKNNTTVVKATVELEELGVIIVHRPDDQKTPNTYSINRKFEAEIDDSGQLVQKIDMVKKCTSSSLKNGHTKHKSFKQKTTTTPAQNPDFIPITDDELRQMGQPVPEAEDLTHLLSPEKQEYAYVAGLFEVGVGMLSPITAPELGQYLDDVRVMIARHPAPSDTPRAVFDYAFKAAADANVRRWDYVRAILDKILEAGSLKAHKANRNTKPKRAAQPMPELTPAQEEAAEVMRQGLGGIKTDRREREVREAILKLWTDGTGAIYDMEKYFKAYRNSWMGEDGLPPASPARILDTWGPLMEPAQNGGRPSRESDPSAIKLSDAQKAAARAMNEAELAKQRGA
jgi:hypothetical protein